MTLGKTYDYLAAVDIETKSLIPDPNGALIPHLSVITVIGLVAQSGDRKVFRGPEAIDECCEYIKQNNLGVIGQNFKFDLRKIIFDRPDLEQFLMERWVGDTLLQAHNLPDKVVDSFLAQYELKREHENDELPKGYTHRKAGALSLKVLAPYFLGVPPFWEDPTDHDNDEYVLKDCEYTLRLFEYFDKRFKEEFPAAGRFYEECQLPWTKMLLKVEVTGIHVDTDRMSQKEYDAVTDRSEAKLILDGMWATIQQEITRKSEGDLQARYEAMALTAIEKLKDKTKAERTHERYANNYAQARAKLDTSINLASPKQLLEVLSEYRGYDVRDFEGKTSTSKEVLQKLAQEGHEDIKTLLKYRSADKLANSYFPAYKLFLRKDTGTMHTTFNPSGARTGRLSSSKPNMQQVAPVLRDMFTARPGYKLVTKDLAALEPVLIAYYTQDPRLMEIVQSGMSFHCVNTKEVFGLQDVPLEEIKHRHADLRKIAKEFGLSVLYGAGGNRVQKSFLKQGVSRDIAQCKQYVYKLRDTYAGVWQFKEELDSMLQRGDVVYNYMGRPIVFNDPEEVYMKGFNRLIQGSGSDILQAAAHDISQEPGCQVLLLVHDELVVEVPEKRAEELERRVEFHMTKWDLTNDMGTVKLKVEGGIDLCWKK